jgi:hypothetical protein
MLLPKTQVAKVNRIKKGRNENIGGWAQQKQWNLTCWKENWGSTNDHFTIA